MLDLYPVVCVRVTPIMPGVDLPPAQMLEPIVRIDLGYATPTPVLDMELTDGAVSAVVPFDGQPTRITIPWDSIVVMHPDQPTDGEDLPIVNLAGKAGSLVQRALEDKANGPKPRTPGPSPTRSYLRLVKND